MLAGVALALSYGLMRVADPTVDRLRNPVLGRSLDCASGRRGFATTDTAGVQSP